MEKSANTVLSSSAMGAAEVIVNEIVKVTRPI